MWVSKYCLLFYPKLLYFLYMREHLRYAVTKVFLDFVLPKAENGKVFCDKLSVYLPVALHISGYLGHPKSLVVPYTMLLLLPIIPVPKLPIHEDGEFVFLDGNIWFAGQVLGIGLVPKATVP